MVRMHTLTKEVSVLLNGEIRRQHTDRTFLVKHVSKIKMLLD